MSMKKIYELLGPNSLTFMVEQDRKHWLLKTQKQKQLIDPNTGDSYQGRIDNLGSDIIIESRKLNMDYSSSTNVPYNEPFSQIFQTEPSAFTYNASLDGLVFARIISVNIPYQGRNVHNYRIKFTDCEQVCIPFGSSVYSDEVYADKWLHTTTPPIIQLMDSGGTYSVDLPVTFASVEFYNLVSSKPNNWETNWFDYYIKTSQGYEHIPNDLTEAPKFVPKNYYEKLTQTPGGFEFYYPLNENIQPFPVSPDADIDTWYTTAINSIDQLGLPGFWFRCSTTWSGPNIKVVDACSEYACIGNEGNDSKYRAHMYIGVEGNYNATPNNQPTDQVKLVVTPMLGNVQFVGEPSDFTIDLHPSRIIMKNIDDVGDGTPIEFTGRGTTTFRMSQNENWVMEDAQHYSIVVSTFDGNCRMHHHDPLLPVLDIRLDESKAFGKQTSDTGYVGIRSGSGNTESDIYEKYPYDLNKFDGLPEHLSDSSIEAPPEHMAIYAIHNTPDYIEGEPDTRQTAGLLLDPGRTAKPYNLIDYDFWLPGDPGSIQNGFSKNYLDNDYPGDRWFIHFTNRGYDIPSHAAGSSLRCYDENDLLRCILFAPTKTNNGADINPDFYDTSTGAIKLFGLSFHEQEMVKVIDWTDPQNTKIDGSGFEYVDIVKVTADAPDGAAIPYATGIQFRMYRNLDMDEANYTRGRVYVLSNDPCEYENNHTTVYPKPDRTAARICDIPTSIAQLSGIHNIAPQNVVDQAYVRTEASYTERDRNQLYNVNSTRWVRPWHLNAMGEHIERDNDYVFTSASQLSQIDLVNHNDFRYHENLVPMVDPSHVSIAEITNQGTDYTIESFGYIYIGGFAFEYHVQSVGDDGNVTSVSLSYPELENDRQINLANFNLSNQSGFTQEYGTTPHTSGDGTGLKVILYIDNYAEIKEYQGEIFTDLFALVKEADGLWLYQYEINQQQVGVFPKLGEWKREIQLAQYESDSGDLVYPTTCDAFMTSILPRKTTLPICRFNKENLIDNLDVISTASFVQVLNGRVKRTPIIEDTSVPIPNTSFDMNMFYGEQRLNFSVSELTDDNVVKGVASVNGGIVPADCYIAWKALDSSNVEAWIIHRSFNNLRSDATTTTLPDNNLKYPNYVNSNTNTIVSWDVENVGPMVWIFNPEYKYHETYVLDKTTCKLVIKRDKMSWRNIVFRTNNVREEVSLFDSNNNITYNIITNSLSHATTPSGGSIYQQPNFIRLINAGASEASINNSKIPTGNWQCIFPRVSEFMLTNSETGKSVVPIEMQALRNVVVEDTDHITEVNNGFDVTNKTMIMKDTSNGVEIKVWNSTENRWVII